MAFAIPFGRTKGTPITEAETKDLQHCVKYIEGKLAENPQKDHADRDRAWVKAARSELDKRSGQQALPTRPPRQAPQNGTVDAPAHGSASTTDRQIRQSGAMVIATPEDVDLVQGSYQESAKVNEIFRLIQDKAHLISPTPTVGRLPTGCAVTLSVMWVDSRESKDGGEVYPTGGGKFGIEKSALLRVAGAAGISWDVDRCQRLDDGSHPHYCCYRAVGSVIDFDGIERVLAPKTIELDLRDGSAQIASMKARSRSGDIDQQLREMRLFILRHTEGRAVAGLIRNLGMKTGYTMADLQKPFVCARLVFTGESNDPATKAMFDKMIAARMLGGRASLYGRTAPELPARAAPSLMAPPPVDSTPSGTVVDEDEDWATGESPAPTPQTSSPPATSATPPASKSERIEGLPTDQDRGNDPNNY